MVIEEAIRIKTSHNTGIQYSDGKIKMLEVYELDFKENKAQSFDYVQESMSPDNIAVNQYKYFKVEFANGRSVICTSFEEFLEIVKE